LLTNKYLNGIPTDSRAAKTQSFLSKDQVTEDIVKRVKKLNEVAVERGQNLAQMALAWVLRNGRVTSALIGASKVSQIEENVAALKNLSFSEEELNRIEDILKS
jgi:L-glyceraldehyde 3-phosphate reductase